MKSDSIKKRREERLRQLRERSFEKAYSYDDEFQADYDYAAERRSGYSRERKYVWNDGYEQEHEPETTTYFSRKFLLKSVLSLFIVSLVFLLQNTSFPLASSGKQFVTEVMTREYNFAGTVAWLEKKLGAAPTILPVFSGSEKGQPVSTISENGMDYVVPVKGKVITPFAMDGKGIQIATETEANVLAIDQGWVVFVGQKEELGQTIIVQHVDQTQSIYANVNPIELGENDWVYPGQTIAHVGEGDKLYFSLIKNDHALDPTSVIPFE
ncbi:M23 family metallopeptidase [Ammoniphilus resinae]|uniref:Stage IV sporulation protein FA n=1 Tax=Ammoniphilus resinae TaxID=861532 RepID=A0ABS4GJH3_9BACL|nr:M23 family metallopeptidase [Ammoniphilus resinae]MBP1930413.1 stage IV sporulation protein FA [Ammoniphilus resinae]